MGGNDNMTLLQYANNRVKKFNIFDLKLAQLAGIFVVLILVKLIPDIMKINIWWFIVLLVLSAIRPIYVFFIKK